MSITRSTKDFFETSLSAAHTTGTYFRMLFANSGVLYASLTGKNATVERILANVFTKFQGDLEADNRPPMSSPNQSSPDAVCSGPTSVPGTYLERSVETFTGSILMSTFSGKEMFALNQLTAIHRRTTTKVRVHDNKGGQTKGGDRLVAANNCIFVSLESSE